MKKIISIVTATRAEYGLLKPIIAKLNEVEELKISIINAQKKNEGIRNYINTLESEYAEFIEIIEKS